LTAPSSIYRGRFAPSPTGPLHFGSLVTAVASYLQAKTQRGEWLIRIEDIDPPREIAGSAESILEALSVHGFEWQVEDELWQSSRLDEYQAIIKRLVESEQAYICTCTRKQLKATAVQSPQGLIYPGTCRAAKHPYTETNAVRLKVGNTSIALHDKLQGRSVHHLDTMLGDFLIRRGDGLVAYQLAVTVDDAFQNITEVVRGIDLLPSTPYQIFLQQVLGYATPAYAHIPVAVNETGQKLSKQTGAEGLDLATPGNNLLRALVFLQMQPPASLATATLSEIWGWASENWNISLLNSISQKPQIGHFP